MTKVRLRNARQELMTMLAGPMDGIQAFLDTIDVELENVEDVTQDDLDEVAGAVEGLASLHPRVTRTVMLSTMRELSALSTTHISKAMAHRLVELGINPLAGIVIGELQLPGLTIIEGPMAGMEIAAAPALRRGDRLLCDMALIHEHMTWDAMEDTITIYNVEVPDSAMTLLAGEPLSRLVECDLVDGLDLRIREVRRTTNGNTDVVLAGTEWMPLSAIERFIQEQTEGKTP